MRYLGLGLVCLALSACTVDNPLYTPGVSGDLAGASDGPIKGAGDLAGLPNKSDMGQPMACMMGERTCLASSAAAGCRMGSFVKDRMCPTGSTCASGHCAAPPPATNNVGKNCAPTGLPTESLCVAGLSGGSSSIPSCEPFIDPAAPTDGKVLWVCAPPIGTGAPGMACTEGPQCRSGFCGSNGTCFRSCITEADCPSNGPGGGWKCSVVSITVEGVSLMASSCVL